LYIDLLLSSEFLRFQTKPDLLKEIVEASTPVQHPVIIDEIQRIPNLLNDVHWLIVNKNIQFILSGSSPRNILRSGVNLLGGRAMRYELYPLVFAEIEQFDLLRAINHGLLPRHYLSNSPHKLIAAYLGSYLKNEIMAEAKIRNISSFARFLEIAAMTNGEIVNYSNIASECGVSAPTIREYFQILQDTLTGRLLPSYQKRAKRRVIQAPRFFFFDVGIVNGLLRRKNILQGSEAFGKAFEHLMYQELYAYSLYSGKNFEFAYWRTASGIEVDFVLGDGEVAVEVKSSDSIQNRHMKGIRQFAAEFNPRKNIVVSNDKYPRIAGNVHILPWEEFLTRLWNDDII